MTTLIIKEMTALEFLNDMGNTHFYNIDTLNNPIPVMERYANYKTKELENKILDFRMRMPLHSFLTIRDYYDKHFNLTTQRHGTTG